MPEIEDVALFDMDGTLCDYEQGLLDKLEELRSPYEPKIESWNRKQPDYINARADLIRLSEDWWAKLPKFQLGWEVMAIAKELNYEIMILTQGPRKNPFSLSGKKMWMDKHLGEEMDYTITRRKGRVYGRVLVDDYQEYIEEWLKWRKNGVVIMPANESNKDFEHPQVTRYDGTNLYKVREVMTKAKR